MWTWNPYELSEIESAIAQNTDGVMGDNPKGAREIIDKMRKSQNDS